MLGWLMQAAARRAHNQAVTETRQWAEAASRTEMHHALHRIAVTEKRGKRWFCVFYGRTRIPHIPEATKVREPAL